MNFKYFFLVILFFSCGVKKAPVPENKLPSVLNRYEQKSEVKKKKKEDESDTSSRKQSKE